MQGEAHPQCMVGCDGAKDVGVLDEGAEEVHGVYAHMAGWRRPHYCGIIWIT